MSIGSLGMIGSAAATPLSQTKGSDVDRAQQDAGAQQRQISTAEKAASAAGIAETDGKEHQSNERDADGRRPWEIEAKKKAAETGADATAEGTQCKDPTG